MAEELGQTDEQDWGEGGEGVGVVWSGSEMS